MLSGIIKKNFLVLEEMQGFVTGKQNKQTSNLKSMP